MPNRIFFLTYDSLDHCEASKKHSVVGYDLESSQAQRLKKVSAGDLIILRSLHHASALYLYGAFDVVGAPKQVDRTAPLVWLQEKAAGQVLYELRVPVSYNHQISQRMPNVVQYSEFVKLGLTNTNGKPYTSTALGVLFRANMVRPENDAAIRKLLNIDG